MKKIILLIGLLTMGLLKTHAQSTEFEIIGSEEYGRIFDVTYDENIENRLYATTLGNHILKSDDNGNNWEVLYALENGTIDGLRFLNEQNSLTFYTKNLNRTSIFVFDLQTESISKEYQLPYQQANQEWLNDYEIWNNNLDVVVAIQEYKIGIVVFQKVYYTENGGLDWNEIYSKENHDDVSVNSITISPDNPEKIFMGRGVGSQGIYGGLWISEDKGQTWTEKLPGITFKPITFHPENPNEIWIGSSLSGSSGQEESLYKSTDSGETWELIPLEWTDYIQDCINIIGINPVNPNHIVILEENEVIISKDGGANWQTYVYPGYDEINEYSYGLNITFNPFNEEELWVSANYFPMFSSDSGANMERQKTPFFVGEGNVAYIENSNEKHLYYGAQYGYIHRDLQTMEEQEYDILPLNYFTINIPTTLYTDPEIPGRIFTYSGGFMGKELKVSDDHGENRTTIYTGFAEQCTAIVPLPDNHNKVWAVFANLSTDVNIKEIDFSDIQNPQVNSIVPPRNSTDIFNIYFDPENSQNILLSQGGKMYRSSNGGNTWEESNNGLETLDPDSDIIIKLIENPLNENQITIATSKGVFTTLNNGETWNQILNKPAHNIKYSNQSEGQIIAVVHNSEVSQFGIMYSLHDGEDWEEINPNELLHVQTGHVLNSSDIVFEEEKANIYISSIGLGLIQYTIDLESLSIEDIEVISGEKLIIYPNPATDTVHIQYSETIQNYEVFNANGKKMLDGNNLKNINITTLPSGIYYIRAKNENKKYLFGKFIKK